MEAMICGGVYEVKETSSIKHGTMVGVTFEGNDTVGAVLFAGHAPELVRLGSDRWRMFKLIGRPASPKVGRPKKG